MAYYSVAGRTDVLITSVRGPKVAAAAACGFYLREVGITNTTATQVRVGLKRVTAVGSGGSALTEVDWNEDLITGQAVATNTPTADDTAGGGFFRQTELGAAIGSAHIWTFPPGGFFVPEGTSNGVGIYLPGGTAQHIDFWFDWEH